MATTGVHHRITGLSHIALFTSDLRASMKFYGDFLGYQEQFRLNEPDGKLALSFVKINELQCIELFPEREARTDRLYQIAFIVENDPCSIGIITALEESGKAKNAVIVTQGVQSDTRPLIKGGASPVKAGVAYFPENYADEGMGKFIEIIKMVKSGKSIDDAYKAVIKDTIEFAADNQTYVGQAIYVKTELITAANIDTFYPAKK